MSTVNADNVDLQPWGCVGFDDIVNGPGAREVPDFLPTRTELLELAKYWELISLDTEYFVFATGQTGSTEIRLIPYAERRVARIVELLGDDAVKAVREVRNEFAKRVTTPTWEDFRRYLGLDATDEQ